MLRLSQGCNRGDNSLFFAAFDRDFYRSMCSIFACDDIGTAGRVGITTREIHITFCEER